MGVRQEGARHSRFGFTPRPRPAVLVPSLEISSRAFTGLNARYASNIIIFGVITRDTVPNIY